MFEPKRTLRVLARPAFSNRSENPYNHLLYSGLARLGVDVHEFGVQNCLLGRYDVCHLHWPESTFNASLLEGMATTEALLLALDWLRKRGTKVVWTAHNLRAHERRFPRAEQVFWRKFMRRVDGVIALSESSLIATRAAFPALDFKPGFVVPHPHYRSEYPDGVTRSQARALLGLDPNARVVLFFGRILAYKNVPELIEVVRSIPDSAGKKTLLLVAGRPYDARSEQAVRAAAARDPRIVLRLRFVPKQEAQNYFRAADLLALPYREIMNSGAAVLGLGFDRPVLMPRRGAGAELERSIGGGWLHLYETLSPHAIQSALTRASQLPPVTDGRQLSCLDPSAVAMRTLSAYESLLGTARSLGVSQSEAAQ
jgi:glycosyltransferase involved in cell wall biosynthesis